MAEIEKKPKKVSWLEKLKISLKNNKSNSYKNISDIQIEFEAIIEEKENQFKIYKERINDEFEDKIKILKVLSNESISKIKEEHKETEEKLLEKIKLLQSEVINLEKENDSKNEELRNLTQEKENIIDLKIKENANLKSKIKFISSANKASNENNKLITDKNQSLSKKLIQYEEEIKNITKKYEISKNKVNETNLIDKLNQKEKELSQLNNLKKHLEDDLKKLNQEKNNNEKQNLNDLILLKKEIKNLKLVNNDLLSENQELINKLISQEKEINKKLIQGPDIEKKNSNETFSEIYNFEKWMKTKTNLSESSVNKYVNSVSNMRLDLIRMRNVDIFNSLNQDQENLEKLLDIWLTENLEKDRKGNNMYSAGFRKFLIFKSFNETYKLTQIDNDDIELGQLNFSIKVYHSLMRNGYRKLSDIKNLTDWEILGMKNMGESGLLEIRSTLKRYKSSEHTLFNENKKNDFDNELSNLNIKNDNEINTKSERINSEVKEDVNQEQSLFKLDFAKLEQAKLEQKQTDERLNEIYSIQYDDESEIEEEEEENLENGNNIDNQADNKNDSGKLVYKSYYQALIKFIEDNIDEEEAIKKELLIFFINSNSLNEEEFLEEINNFCYEEFNDLLLEEDDDIFYVTKEVFENFKISFSAND